MSGFVCFCSSSAVFTSVSSVSGFVCFCSSSAVFTSVSSVSGFVRDQLLHLSVGGLGLSAISYSCICQFGEWVCLLVCSRLLRQLSVL